MSLVLWPMLTWSLGWIGFAAAKRSPPRSSIARLAITSLTFMLRRGAGAGLIDVDGELVVEAAVGHFAGRRRSGHRPGRE